MAWSLKHIESGELIFLKSLYNIGRDKNADLICRSQLVSRHHAKLSTTVNGRLWVEDKGSSNGTFINNERIPEYKDKELREEDELGFGIYRKREGFPEEFDKPHHIYKVLKTVTETIVIDSDDDDYESNSKVSVSKDVTETTVKVEKGSDNELEVKKELILKELEELDSIQEEDDVIICENDEEAVPLPPPTTSQLPPSAALQIPPATTEPLLAKAASSASIITVLSKSFSDNDPVIVIDDDDDENDFGLMHSQLYIKKELQDTTKQSTDPNEGISNSQFLKIKQELQQLDDYDDYDRLPIIPINDWSSDDGLSGLEDNDSKDAPNKLTLLLDNSTKSVDLLPDDFSKSVDLAQGVDVVHYNSNNESSDVVCDRTVDSLTVEENDPITDEKDDQITAEKDDRITSVKVTDNENNNKRKPSGVIMIEAQQLKKRRRTLERTKQIINNDCEKGKGKNKKKGSYNIPFKLGNKSDISKEKKVEIKECRMKRLKEMNDKKESTVNENPNPKPRVNNTRKFIKNSVSRSDHLLVDTIQSTKKPIQSVNTKEKAISSIDNNEKSTKLVNNKEKATKSINSKDILTKSVNNQEKATSSNKNEKRTKPVSREEKATTVVNNKEKLSKSVNNKENPLSGKNKAAKPVYNKENATKRTIDNTEKLPHQSDSSKRTKVELSIRHSETENPSDIEKIAQSNFPKQQEVAVIRNVTKPLTKLLADHGDLLYSVINWNKQWVDEQKMHKDPPPPILRSVIKMCYAFDSFSDYFSTVQPLMVLDYWFTLCKEYGSISYNQNNCCSFSAIIKKVDRKEKHIELTCCSYPNADQESLHERNLLMLALECREVDQKIFKSIFGVVTSVHREKIQPTDIIEDCGLVSNDDFHTKCKLVFSIIIKTCHEFIQPRFRLVGRYFSSFNYLLRLSYALKSLERSLLKRHILAPSEEDYVMPYIANRKLIYDDQLNSSQTEAVIEASYLCSQQAPGIYLIEGAPGTGKTKVIVNIIFELLLKKQNNNRMRILLLAPTNCAIDNLLKKVLNVRPKLNEDDKKKLKLVRIGLHYTPTHSVVQNTLQELIKINMKKEFFVEHPQCKRDYDNLCNELNELRKNANYSAEFKELYIEKCQIVDNFMKDYLKGRYNKFYESVKLSVLNGANIICSTIGSCSKLFTSGFCTSNITCCIIDDATQCSETETLIPISLGINRLVLVGDPQQIPADTSLLSKEYSYDKSLFSRINYNLSRKSCIKRLDTQYRMHPEIAKFPNRYFYSGILRNPLDFREDRISKILLPYLVFNQSVLNTDNYNECEVHYAFLLVKAIVSLVGSETELSIGLITPDYDQKNRIIEKLKEIKSSSKISVICSTVDSFQGQEKDIIILSCVRNSTNLFLSDEQRLNVAITRAKYGLYIIGTRTLFESCKILNRLKCDAEDRHFFYNLTIKIKDSTVFENLIKRK